MISKKRVPTLSLLQPAVNAVSHRLFEKAHKAVSEDRKLLDIAKYDADVCLSWGALAVMRTWMNLIRCIRCMMTSQNQYWWEREAGCGSRLGSTVMEGLEGGIRHQ